jgi:hypothetical protein
MVMNGGWPNYVNPASYLDGGGEAGSGGFNPISGIIDGLVGSFKSAFPAAGIVADVAIGVGKKLMTDVADFITGSGGKDRRAKGSTFAPTLYDGGGWLENTGGAQLVQHNKRKPDAVLSSAQWATMTRIADNTASGASGFPSSLRLVVDGHEFTAYVDGRVDSGMAGKASIASGRMR